MEQEEKLWDNLEKRASHLAALEPKEEHGRAQKVDLN